MAGERIGGIRRCACSTCRRVVQRAAGPERRSPPHAEDHFFFLFFLSFFLSFFDFLAMVASLQRCVGLPAVRRAATELRSRQAAVSAAAVG
jgi:hypothetical protein